MASEDPLVTVRQSTLDRLKSRLTALELKCGKLEEEIKHTLD